MNVYEICVFAVTIRYVQTAQETNQNPITTSNNNNKYVPFAGLISVLGLAGNGIVVVVITALRRRGQENAVQLFLLHLAISDLLVCLLCIPLTIFTNFYYPEEYQKNLDGLCKLSRFMQVRMAIYNFNDEKQVGPPYF